MRGRIPGPQCLQMNLGAKFSGGSHHHSLGSAKLWLWGDASLDLKSCKKSTRARKCEPLGLSEVSMIRGVH